MELKPDERINEARNNFYRFCKLMDPDFFADDCPHQKELCDMLQDLFGKRIINLVTGKTYTKMIIDMPAKLGRSRMLALFSQWCLGVDTDTRILSVLPDRFKAERVSNQMWLSIRGSLVDDRLTMFTEIFPKISVNYGHGPSRPWGICGNSYNYIAVGYGDNHYNLAGIGANVGIIDEPPTSTDENAKEAIKDWYINIFQSRVYHNGITIIAADGWEDDSLIADLIDKEDWLSFTTNPEYYMNFDYGDMPTLKYGA